MLYRRSGEAGLGIMTVEHETGIDVALGHAGAQIDTTKQPMVVEDGKHLSAVVFDSSLTFDGAT